MENEIPANENIFEETAVPAPAPKRRGRPPKIHTENVSAETPTPAPKRRGRPPKVHTENASAETPAGAPAQSNVSENVSENANAASATPSLFSAPAQEKPEPRAEERPAPSARPQAAFSFDPADDDSGDDARDTGTPAQIDPAEIVARNRPQTFSPFPEEKISGENVSAAPGNSPANNTAGTDARPNRWDRFANRGEKWEKRTPQRFNPQDRSGVKPFPRFQQRDRALPPQQQAQSGAQAGGNAPAQSPTNPSTFAQKPGTQNQPRFQKREKFQAGKFNAQGKFDKFKEREIAQKPSWGALANKDSAEEATLDIGNSFDYNKLKEESLLDSMRELAKHTVRIDRGENAVCEPGATPPIPAATDARVPCEPGEPLNFNEIYDLPMDELVARAKSLGIPVFRNPQRRPLIRKIMNAAFSENRPIELSGTLELLANGHGLLLYTSDNFRVRELSAFVPSTLIKRLGLQRGHELSTIVHPPMPGETAPIVVEIVSIMGANPEEIKNLTPFTELTPYYPTERIMLETTPDAPNNLSMRCVDLLCPIGLGQRGLIVAPPRVGKTVLLQTMACSILKSKPNAKLIVLLVDERPEEVTDFRRNTTGAEVISSTFDETAENHVHVAEMVIERARRMVELGKDVIILLDSITRLARAYNTLMPNGGKILSGGVEAGALAKPKRFFGSARNIEGGGSLTILGTALIDTGSKMDEVIFEEFKGTGNMELDLDRDLANKRIYPAINFERSGTRKEELLYHPDEMQYVYSMRRAMKGVPSLEAMEMLINRMKKTKTNIEFLMTLSR